jgi:hypothetical protein
MITKDTWEMLARSAQPSGGVVALRLLPESRLNVFAALDQATSHRFVVLKSSDSRVRPRQPLPTGRGFTVLFVATPSDSEGVHSLRFVLTEPLLADIFDVIANDILTSIGASVDDRAAFETFVARIVTWQRFLDELPDTGLTQQAQTGLFAELWFLRAVLLPEMSSARAVRAWAGPRALSKDFQFPGLAFEVKASAAKQHTHFAIASEVQLDSQGIGDLVLYGLLLERLVSGGVSLPELVAAVRMDIGNDPPALLIFADLLLRVGYADVDACKYDARFRVRSARFYSVTDGFPRIVAADLRPGVGDVHYSISDAACQQHSLTESDVREMIHRL